MNCPAATPSLNEPPPPLARSPPTSSSPERSPLPRRLLPLALPLVRLVVVAPSRTRADRQDPDAPLALPGRRARSSPCAPRPCPPACARAGSRRRRRSAVPLSLVVDDIGAVIARLAAGPNEHRRRSPSPSPSSRRARPTSSSSRRQRTRIRSSSLERRRHVVRLCGAQPGRERHQGPQKGRRARDDAQEPRAARVGRRSCCWCVPSFSSFERERASEVGEDARAEER